MKCPYCAEDIQDDAKKCKHCGEWIVKPGSTPASRAVTQGMKNKELHDAIAKVIWLPVGLLSYGVYVVTGSFGVFAMVLVGLFFLFAMWYYKE